jgi:mono/diheme cytochrome c family protein
MRPSLRSDHRATKTGAFSSEVVRYAASREENVLKQKHRARFRFNRNGKGSGVFLGLMFGAAFVFCTAASADELPSATPFLSPGRGFGEQGGAALYANVCAACHQPDAKGAIGAAAYPALAGNKNVASVDYDLTVLLHGQRSMPPVGRMMSDEQVADVINYVRTHFGNSYGETVSAADVKAARPDMGAR